MENSSDRIIRYSDEIDDQFLRRQPIIASLRYPDKY